MLLMAEKKISVGIRHSVCSMTKQIISTQKNLMKMEIHHI